MGQFVILWPMHYKDFGYARFSADRLSMSSLNSSNVRILRLTLVILILFGTSCSPFMTRIPTVADEKLARYVAAIGSEIVAVSEAHDRWADYQFSLAQFARLDILGLSTGNHQIYISYELARRAYNSSGYRWLLRHTLAHEIAHDVLGREAVARITAWTTAASPTG